MISRRSGDTILVHHIQLSHVDIIVNFLILEVGWDGKAGDYEQSHD